MFDNLNFDYPYSYSSLGIGQGKVINYAINWETGCSIMFTEGARFTVIGTTSAKSF